MSRARSDRAETFGPLQDKTLHAVLRQQFMTEFGYGSGPAVADMIVEEVLQTLASYIRPPRALRPGQLLWMAVAHDGAKHARGPMREIPLVPVVLDWVTEAELAALSTGMPFEEAREERMARLLTQALAQGGVLAQSDLAALSLLSRKQVSRAIHKYQVEHATLLPYRGTVQDVGGTLTHKVEVIRLFEAGYLEPEICKRLKMEHDLSAVENYVQTYKHVLKLLERQFTLEEISGILRIGMPLVRAYIDIVQEHHPEILARHPNLGDSQMSS
jgi:hypothetical protein